MVELKQDLKTYLGGNAGVEGIYSNLLNEYNVQPVANIVGNIGFEGDAEDMDNYKTYAKMVKQDRRGDPHKYGYGVTAEYDLLNTPGEFSWDNFDIGAYLNFANKGITFDWNPTTNQKTLGIQMGLSNKREGGRVLPKAQNGHDGAIDIDKNELDDSTIIEGKGEYKCNGIPCTKEEYDAMIASNEADKDKWQILNPYDPDKKYK